MGTGTRKQGGVPIHLRGRCYGGWGRWREVVHVSVARARTMPMHFIGLTDVRAGASGIVRKWQPDPRPTPKALAVRAGRLVQREW